MLRYLPQPQRWISLMAVAMLASLGVGIERITAPQHAGVIPDQHIITEATIAVVNSKKDGGPLFSPTSIAGARTRSTNATMSSRVQGWPFTRNRSSRQCRCGELYRPVRYPAAAKTLATIVAVDPLPLVPAT